MAEMSTAYYAAKLNALRKTVKSLNVYSLPPDDAANVMLAVCRELRQVVERIEDDVTEFKIERDRKSATGK